MRPDVIVVGLGAAGSATLRALARRGARVLGLDRHAPPHDQGSSHGESRVTRQAIGEGEDYVPLAMRAHALWRELEAEAGERLMLPLGCLLIGDPAGKGAHAGKPDFLNRTLAAARRFAIPHEVLDAPAVRDRWPAFRLEGHERAYFEPGAGALLPERCVAAQLASARRAGAEIRADERVLAIESLAGAVRVTTDRGAHEAGCAVLSAGAGAAELLGPNWAGLLQVYRQTLHWFAPADPAAFAPERFPVFMWMHGEAADDWFYGFPVLPGASGVKLAAEVFDAPAAGPDAVDRRVAADEGRTLYARHVAGRLAGLAARPLRSTACLYTMAPDSRFLIGPDPDRPGVTVISACSGHGFKHSPAIGEAVAELVLTGDQPAVLAPFAPADALLRRRTAK